MADTLSQEEIDALLKAMSEGELDESDMKKGEEKKVRNYDFSRPATREEFVHILAQALPGEALSPILTNKPSFDDAGSIVYQSDVDMLSRAGIITGSGNCFLPKNPITRAEVAAVVTRMAKAELRKG